MAKKLEELTFTREELNSLNDTELRQLTEKISKKWVHPYTDRELLIQFLLTRDDKILPENPIDRCRMHMVCHFATHYKAYSPMLLCSGNCFEHSDLQVLECQVQNPALRIEDLNID